MNLRVLLALVLVLPGCFEDITNPEPQDTEGSEESTAAADSTTGEPSVCPEYCSLMRDLCTADFQQYTSDAICGAAGPTGNGVCGAECESFCGLAMDLCTGELAQWPDVPSCITDCMQFPTDAMYNASVTEGDSYACRVYHLTVASLDPDVHCPHIALDSVTCI
jgi:hypothetical protein